MVVMHRLKCLLKGYCTCTGETQVPTPDFAAVEVQVQLIDPGGQRTSIHYTMFMEQFIRGFLAARTVADEIIAIVSLMAESRLPCYARGKPIDNLRKRFHLDESTEQAAAFMRSLVEDAYDKWTTGFYDYIQVLQQGIPM